MQYSVELLNKKIEKFMEEHVLEGYAQRTEEWYQARARQVGGSEIAYVLNMDKKHNQRVLLRRKLGLDSNIIQPAMTWGVIMEPVTAYWATVATGNKIYECQTYKGMCEGTGYSPDGLGVISLPNGKNEIALFEFKNPYFRTPTSVVPPVYNAQIQTGLASLKDEDGTTLCKAGCVYVDSLYRKFSLDNYMKYRGKSLMTGAIGFRLKKRDANSLWFIGDLTRDKRFPEDLLRYRDDFDIVYSPMFAHEKPTVENNEFVTGNCDLYNRVSPRYFEYFKKENKLDIVMVYCLIDSKVILEKEDTEWKDKVIPHIVPFVSRLNILHTRKEELEAMGMSIEQIKGILNKEITK